MSKFYVDITGLTAFHEKIMSHMALKSTVESFISETDPYVVDVDYDQLAFDTGYIVEG